MATSDYFNWEKTKPTNEKLHGLLGPVEFLHLNFCRIHGSTVPHDKFFWTRVKE